MRVRLVDPMPVHPALCYPGTRRPLKAIGLSTDGFPLWPLMGGDGEDDGADEGEGDEGEQADEEDEGGDADDQGDADKDSKKGKKRTGPVSRGDFDALTSRHAATTRRRQELEKEVSDLKKFKEEQERQGNTDLQNAQADLKTVTEERDSLQERFANLARTNAFLTASAQAGIRWYDPEDAQAVAGKELRELEIDEDGTVEGITQLVKDLAKRKKHLVNTSDTDGDEDEGDKASVRRGASGSGVGSVKNGKARGKKGGQLSREELISRFPALKR